MIVRDIPIRVRYYETDAMGVVHHANFVKYYEIARTEMLRQFGTTYKEMEDRGVMMPVLEVQSKYISSAYNDDLLTVRVIVEKMPGARMRFDHKIYRENGELINTGYVLLAFINAETRRACRAPEYFLELLSTNFGK